jgi:hypothetical protein
LKLFYKIAMIGTVLASGIVTASAQNTTRRSYDQPNRFWNMQQAPSGAYYGGGYGYGSWNDPSSYRSGESDTNMWATPGTQEQRDIGANGG